ncbi:hypothetical protein EGR_10360 [Echinococcus granulosus]|uniref:Uncharacterized protein n=1 Tax=Echinococcus granulosus TaxID=6210 RepID=W6U169_ECHGR|nr:hypothetical protein EGR_10360 [Echinococcus granulosus]EUB54783.1 hypothetical protein EGR_10360 [Echinococcus granulosus]
MNKQKWRCVAATSVAIYSCQENAFSTTKGMTTSDANFPPNKAQHQDANFVVKICPSYKHFSYLFESLMNSTDYFFSAPNMRDLSNGRMPPYMFEMIPFVKQIAINICAFRYDIVLNVILLLFAYQCRKNMANKPKLNHFLWMASSCARTFRVYSKEVDEVVRVQVIHLVVSALQIQKYKRLSEVTAPIYFYGIDFSDFIKN